LLSSAKQLPMATGATHQGILDLSRHTQASSTYNRPHLLEAAVACVARERDADAELIVVDDNSQVAVAMPPLGKKTFPKSHLLIRNPHNLGVIGARNAGLAAARGEFVVFLDDDDESLPNRTQDLLAKIENTGFDFVAGCSYMRTGENEKVVPDKSGFALSPEKLLLYPSHINAVIWRRESFVKGLDNRVPYLGEHISMLLCLMHGGTAWLSTDIVARFCYIPAGLTRQAQAGTALKTHLIAMYQILMEESETPAFRQLCDRVLGMLQRESIHAFDAYLEKLLPIIRTFVSLPKQ
jgi:Glycosyl transferase family 2